MSKKNTQQQHQRDEEFNSSFSKGMKITVWVIVVGLVLSTLSLFAF